RTAYSPGWPSQIAPTIATSAAAPSSTCSLTPSSRYSSPSRRAAHDHRSGVQPSPGSARANVAMTLPSASFGSRSAPSAGSTAAAAVTVLRYGTGSSTRPVSSNTTPSSTSDAPKPPCSSAIANAVTPSSPAKRRQSSASNPSAARTRSEVTCRARKRRTVSRSAVCSAVNPNSTHALLTPRHPAEQVVGDDVALDLVGSAVDGVGPREEEQALSVAEAAIGQRRGGSHRGHRPFVDAPVPRRPQQLGDRRLYPRKFPLAPAERAQRLMAQDLQPDPRVHGGVPPHRVVIGPALPGRGEYRLQLTGEADLLAEGGHPSFERQGPGGHTPAVAGRPDDVLR